MKIIVFEDNTADNFYPVSLTRPLWELRFGCFLLRERIENALGKKFEKCAFTYFTRDYLAQYFHEKCPELSINDYSFLKSDTPVFFINARVLPDDLVISCPGNTVYLKDGVPLAALAEPSALPNRELPIAELLLGSDTVKKNLDRLTTVDYLWELVKRNGEMIEYDFSDIESEGTQSPDDSVSIIGEKNRIHIETGAVLDPLVAIDSRNGPVVIRTGTVVHSFSRIEGPCYIGKDCVVLGARIREGCSIGDCCRIGGEVEDSIFHAFSNKYHDGFIGHAYIGEWVNLGALTTNSDLKNNYSEVTVCIPPDIVKTGEMKVGCFIGDFTRTSIGTLINTGTSIGVGTMLLHAGKLSPRHIPSFTWYVDNRIIATIFYKDFIESCRVMTERRGVTFTKAHQAVLDHVRGTTADLRKQEILKWKRKEK